MQRFKLKIWTIIILSEGRRRYLTCRGFHCHLARISLTRAIRIVGLEPATWPAVDYSPCGTSNSCVLTQCNISTPPWQYFSPFWVVMWRVYITGVGNINGWLWLSTFCRSRLLQDRDTVNGGVNFFSREALTSTLNLRFLFSFFLFFFFLQGGKNLDRYRTYRCRTCSACFEIESSCSFITILRCHDERYSITSPCIRKRKDKKIDIRKCKLLKWSGNITDAEGFVVVRNAVLSIVRGGSVF